ncbi:MAG: hypothetical protein V4519_01950 [Patescibacteria group bacterium]
MRNTQEKFLRFYEDTADSVFSTFFEKTDSRSKSIELTKDFFRKSWEKAARGEKLSLIDIKDTSSENRSIQGFKYNQYGY